MKPDVAKFHVRYDPVARRLNWTMRGLWTLDDFDAAVVAMRAAVIPLGSPPYDMDGLSDTRDFPPQRAEVADALSRFDQTSCTVRTGRTAIVVGSMINKLQAERNLIDPNIKVVMNMQDAEDWLRGKGPAAS